MGRLEPCHTLLSCTELHLHSDFCTGFLTWQTTVTADTCVYREEDFSLHRWQVRCLCWPGRDTFDDLAETPLRTGNILIILPQSSPSNPLSWSAGSWQSWFLTRLNFLAASWAEWRTGESDMRRGVFLNNCTIEFVTSKSSKLHT